MAKNQSPDQLSPVLRIHPLESILGPDDEDIFLCPLRALQRYLFLTKSLRTGKRRLFISLNPSKSGDIRTPTLSRWISEVVKSPIPEKSPLLPFLLQELMNFELLLLLSASLTPGVSEMFWILRFGGRRTLLSTFTCGTSAALEKTILVTSHRWWPPSSASPLARGNK